MEQPKAKYRKDYTAPAFTITDTDLTFTLSDEKTVVEAISTVQKISLEATELKLDGKELKLCAIAIDGVPLTEGQYTIDDESLTLYNLPDLCTLSITTEINPKGNSQLEGLYKSGGAFCTQCEAEGFRRITYYLDRPDVLARFTTKIIAPKEHYPYLLSNGNRIASGDVDADTHYVQWKDPFPKPSYLFALVAGDFDLLEDSFTTKSGRDVALEIFVDKGNLNRTEQAMRSLKNAMKWDEERFNLEYDLDIYMIVAVDFFNMGAMENKGLNVFNSKYVLANPETATDTDYLHIEAVIGHEYFHNWTGNRVTCRDWFQLSLKEGLTVFRDQEFSSDLGSRSVNRINNVRIIRGHQFAEDSGPMAHPIRPDKVIEMNNFYTVTVYEKGSEVIRMMHTLLGEDTFQKGIQLYFERHDGTAVTCEDFVSAMEDASCVDLDQFRRWYSQSGTPELTVTSRFNRETEEYTLNVSQKTPETADQKEKLPLHIPLDIDLYDQSGRLIPLKMNGEPCRSILNITDEEMQFVFSDISEEPVLSLLKEFSAPVKLHYDYSDEELAFLMTYSHNDFCRWDAGQNLLAKHIKSMISIILKGDTPVVQDSLVEPFRSVALNRSIDPALVAEIFTLPSENEVAGWFATVDVDAIHTVLTTIRKSFSSCLFIELETLYNDLKLDKYTIAHEDIAKRTLRNCVLGYLSFSNKGCELVRNQYYNANNMTDTISALHAANEAKLTIRQELMQDFSDKWEHDGLVMDKWFLLQGINPDPSALRRIKAEMNHKAFSLSNPNRIRSLIGSFGSNNPKNFHALDGSGYTFIGGIITELNSKNPQIASRLIDPFLKFKKFDEKRQNLMRRELERLAELPDLAKDLYEKISKALS